MSVNIVERLTQHAAARPNARSLIFVDSKLNETDVLTYGLLDRKVRAVAGFLHREMGLPNYTILLLPNSPDFVYAFLGCLYSGSIAVPLKLPESRNRSSYERILSIANNLKARLIITPADHVAVLESALAELSMSHCKVVTPESVFNVSHTWDGLIPANDSLAFIQYSSGTTSAPKGVAVSHQNLIDNENLIRDKFNHSERTVGASWLPFHHDMGLVGSLLQSLYVGIQLILLSPSSFIRNPACWLEVINKYRVVTTGGPNFAYKLCADRIDVEKVADMDLSCWSNAFIGAEPIHAGTLAEFARKFSKVSFNSIAFFPCYGLAEATLFVSGGGSAGMPRVYDFDKAALLSNNVRVLRSLEIDGAKDAHEDDKRAHRLVSVGSIDGDKVRIVNPGSFEQCAANEVGEIWVDNKGAARGYLDSRDGHVEPFDAAIKGGGAERYLRTGDLGFMLGDQLFVSGRLKDLIIVNGQNHHPQDIEHSITSSIPALAANACAVFSGFDSTGEVPVVVQEIGRKLAGSEELPALAKLIVQIVSELHGLHVGSVSFVPAGSIPRTTSGKIQRSLIGDKIGDGGIKILLKYENESNARVDRVPVSGPVDETQLKVASIISTVANCSPDHDRNLFEYGLDSVQVAQIISTIAGEFKIDISFDELVSTPTIQKIASHIDEKLYIQESSKLNLVLDREDVEVREI